MKKDKKITKELRKQIALSIVEKAEQSGLSGVSLNKDEVSGRLYVGEDSFLDWKISEHGDFYTAGTLPDTTGSVDYLSKAKDYEDISNDREKLIKLSRMAYRNEGIVGTAFQAIVELASLSGWWVEEENDELRKLLYYWLENLSGIGSAEGVRSDSNSDTVDSNTGIERIINNMLYGILIDADYVATEQWENVFVPVIGAKRNLITRYIQHDVLYLHIDETLAKIGKEIITAELPDEIINIVKDGPTSDTEKAIYNSLSPELIQSIKNGGTTIKLPSSLTVHLSGRNNDITPWGTPYLTRAFPAFAYKHRLRALDNATITGLIQRLWIVKIGHDDPKSTFHVPDNDRVLLAVSALKKLKTQSLMVWGGSDLSTEELKSSDSNILGLSDRYRSADDDILQALGVPRVLIDGTFGGSKGGADDTAFVKIESQIERFQIIIKRYLEKAMRQIAVENGYKDSFPKFNFMFLKLLSQSKVKNVVLNIYEKNLIGVRRALYLMGLNGHKVVEEMIKEKEEGLRDKLPVNIIPYSKAPGRPDGTQDGDGVEDRNTHPSDPDSNREGK